MSESQGLLCLVVAPWKISAVHPGAFVLCLYEMKPAIVLSKLDVMSADRKRSRAETLAILRKTMAAFAGLIAKELEIPLDQIEPSNSK